jgi:amino acid transporter
MASQIIALPLLAAPITGDLDYDMVEQEMAFAGEAGFSEIQLGGFFAGLIGGFFSLLAIIFIIIIIIAGYNWMTAGGDEEKLRKAKASINRAVIGLIVTIGSLSITYFVFKYVPFGPSPPTF